MVRAPQLRAPTIEGRVDLVTYADDCIPSREHEHVACDDRVIPALEERNSLWRAAEEDGDPSGQRQAADGNQMPLTLLRRAICLYLVVAHEGSIVCMVPYKRLDYQKRLTPGALEI